MKDSEIVLNILSEAQLGFIEAEFAVTKAIIKEMDDDAISNLYDKICDIEVAETIASESKNEEYSERGLIAEGIVTIIGNELYAISEEDPDEMESA